MKLKIKELITKLRMYKFFFIQNQVPILYCLTRIILYEYIYLSGEVLVHCLWGGGG